MKKKKITLLFALALSTVSLASCGERDYFSKDFEVNSRAMDSKATVEYKTDTELSDLYVELEKKNSKENYDKFLNDNKTIIMSQHEKFYDANKKSITLEYKSKTIFDTTNGSIYYYEYYHEINDDYESSYSMVTKAIEENDQYTIITDLEFNNFHYYCMDAKYNYTSKKVDGSAKVTATQTINLDYTKQQIFNFCSSPVFYNKFPNTENPKVYSTEDLSYIYASCDVNEAGLGLYKYTSITDNSLVSYVACEASDINGMNSNGKIDVGAYMQYEYLNYSVLDNKISTEGYNSYNTSIWNNPSSSYFYILPKTYSFSLGIFSSDLYNFLSNEEEVLTSLTFKEL